jgi:hypothetical protein
MAIAPDPYTKKAAKYLLVASADSQYISVFDLDTLSGPSNITLPGSDFGRSVAVANNAILALAVDKKNIVGDVSVLDLTTGLGTSLATLGSWSNDAGWISADSVLIASSNGDKVLMAGSDGHVSLYSATAGAFTASNQDFKTLAGAYAASSYGYYIIGNNILNSALGPVGLLGVPLGATSSGFAFLDSNDAANGYFATSPIKITSAAPGSIQYFPAVASGFQSPIETAEASLLSTSNGSSPTGSSPGSSSTSPSSSSTTSASVYPSPDGTVSNNGSGANSTWQESVFSRTVAPLTSGQIVELSTSGFTVLGAGYASAFQPPNLTSITSAGDYTAKVAPGGLVSVWGTGMSPTSVVASQVPLPTSLNQSCLSVAGTPIPLVFVSPKQINAQLPNNVLGNETISLHTPGGVSNTLPLHGSVGRAGCVYLRQRRAGHGSGHDCSRRQLPARNPHQSNSWGRHAGDLSYRHGSHQSLGDGRLGRAHQSSGRGVHCAHGDVGRNPTDRSVRRSGAGRGRRLPDQCGRSRRRLPRA